VKLSNQLSWIIHRVENPSNISLPFCLHFSNRLGIKGLINDQILAQPNWFTVWASTAFVNTLSTHLATYPFFIAHDRVVSGPLLFYDLLWSVIVAELDFAVIFLYVWLLLLQSILLRHVVVLDSPIQSVLYPLRIGIVVVLGRGGPLSKIVPCIFSSVEWLVAVLCLLPATIGARILGFHLWIIKDIWWCVHLLN
jgi:hypothetical protein